MDLDCELKDFKTCRILVIGSYSSDFLKSYTLISGSLLNTQNDINFKFVTGILHENVWQRFNTPVAYLFISNGSDPQKHLWT